MHLAFHGGKCCGIKTIYELDQSPDDVAYEVKKVELKDNWGNKLPALEHDRFYKNVSSDLDFFTDDAPKESCGDRFDRLVSFCRKHRPGGIIETVVNEDECDDEDDSQYYYWQPFLEKRGFEMVTSAYNSNSGNTIHVFHLVTK